MQKKTYNRKNLLLKFIKPLKFYKKAPLFRKTWKNHYFRKGDIVELFIIEALVVKKFNKKDKN